MTTLFGPEVVATISSPKPGDVLAAGGSYDVTVQAASDSPIMNMIVTITSPASKYALFGFPFPVPGAQLIENNTMTGKFSPLTPGAYTVQATAVDFSGRAHTRESFVVEVK